MKRYLKIAKVAIPIICILALVPVMAAKADCGIVYTGTCTSTVIISGQTTQRVSGSITVHDYSQNWGESSTIIPQGYWAPTEGTQGVRWDCSDSYINGVGIGWKVVYTGGQWHAVTEDALTVDVNGVMPGDPGYIPTYVKKPVRYGHSATACQYIAPGMDVSTVRWRDTRDEWYTIPFQDIIIIPWQKIIVTTNYYNIQVSMPYPSARVTRNPWPRAIAGQPVHFTATVDPIEAASDPIASCTPDIFDYVLHIRLTPMKDVPPVWNFDERSWSKQPGTASGWDVTHIFDTASYNLSGDGTSMSSDKPAIGPSMDGATKLPSYKVGLTMAWLVEANRTWVDFSGTPRQTGWQAVDLTQYGYNTPYLVTTGAKDVTTPPAGVPKQDLPPFVVPVPVIESQGILTAP